MSDRLDAGELARSWKRSLRARNRADRTIATYLDAVARLDVYAREHRLDPFARRTIEAHLADLTDRAKPATVASRYRSLQQWFK
ncbi:MAG: phage integrase N-terminal SAM-like domain-containing protein, partial [Actinomycetota bacterium]|nr:phage integrase N-terminal SAM-like domain-containing protein [Actinomycetota bacterium]